jgi:hypothetical protein
MAETAARRGSTRSGGVCAERWNTPVHLPTCGAHQVELADRVAPSRGDKSRTDTQDAQGLCVAAHGSVPLHALRRPTTWGVSKNLRTRSPADADSSHGLFDTQAGLAASLSAFGATARCARARSGLDPFVRRVRRRGRRDVAEDRQQGVELGVGQAGSGFHLTLVSAVHPHGLAASIDF